MLTSWLVVVQPAVAGTSGSTDIRLFFGQQTMAPMDAESKEAADRAFVRMLVKSGQPLDLGDAEDFREWISAVSGGRSVHPNSKAPHYLILLYSILFLSKTELVV
jgi:hypothetical protein